MGLLSGKVLVVTGASRGIGRSIAIKAAQNGADVAFSDLKADENLFSLEKELIALGVKAKGYASDASNHEDSQKFIDEVIKDFGKVDALVNNAGITRDALLMRMTEEQWDMVMNVNLKSVFNLTKAVQKYMLKQKYGSIINISSVVGVGGNAGQANYAASKAGIIGFSKSIAKELGSRNIRCNAIAPGFIETDMTKTLPPDIIQEWYNKIPMKRGGTPDEVAGVVVFLASDLSSYVTGQCINVCGAMQT
ncbi:MAG TPA: 3-oxoacyl-[acyl-carrier-protein] reductase [Bacteroidales bacterium]|jgi:3-oxoacyl-[acyl-carrier protein] reductase|nr:3-oxoacyl-[acyl-carrier-protein] reductase [Bacteroidales bacterium]